jgi:hypothetical protein
VIGPRLDRLQERRLLGPFARIHHRAEHPNHIEDPCDASLIGRMDVETAANEIGGDVRLQIGERQDEPGPSARILSIFAEVKALTRGFSRRACAGRTT